MTFKDAFTEVIKGYEYQYPYKESKEEMIALIQAAATICASRELTEQLMGLLVREEIERLKN